jgi:hypothetical protein
MPVARRPFPPALVTSPLPAPFDLASRLAKLPGPAAQPVCLARPLLGTWPDPVLWVEWPLPDARLQLVREHWRLWRLFVTRGSSRRLLVETDSQLLAELLFLAEVRRHG